jgi:hypothetical protein
LINISNFLEVNENINKVLDKLIQSQNLCKYLYYTTGNPLTEADIVNTTSLLYDKIFPYPTSTEIFKDANGIPEASSAINVLFDDFKPTSNNKFMCGKLTFIVMCHTSLWKLDVSQLRPICILYEIAKMFTEQRVVGVGKGEFNGCNITWADKDYSGYRLSYKDYEFQ